MKREFLGEIDQLTSFLYFSSEDKKFRKHHATDMFKGDLISANTDSSLEDLIFPYSLGGLKEALKVSGRKDVLNSEVIEIMPCDNIRHSKEYGGVIGSMSNKNVTFHSVDIRNAHDPEIVESSCDCFKESKKRYIGGIWFPAILKEWKLDDNRKYYAISTCPHKSALDFQLRKVANIHCLGIEDNLEYMTPYVLSFIDVIKEFPKFPDYVFDFAYVYESSMFDKAKEQINEIKRSYGLEDLRMYSNPYLKRYIRSKMGINSETMKKVVETMGY